MYIARSVEPKIKEWLFKGKIIVIYGARQTGKSTLVRKIMADYPGSKYLNSEAGEIKRLFKKAEDPSTLIKIIGEDKKGIVVLDEAQKIEDIGIKLKLLIDTFPDRQIIATGSSSFDLANKINEPLTGRTVPFMLYPFSLSELKKAFGTEEIDLQLENLLIYGFYPAVVLAASLEEKLFLLKQLVLDYLYKDVLSFDRVQKSEVLKELTEAIALQTGGEVSFNELANLLQIGKQTVVSYLDILEQGYILFKLTSYSRNLRQEINRSRKIYPYDTGVRNALINNLNPISLRNDIGALWENFIVSEFKKQQYWAGNSSPLYFWRTYSQEEVDLIKDEGGVLHGFEIKWQKNKKHAPKNWLKAYPNSTWQNITKDNYLEILVK